jgi:N-acetylmuramoyl-L-alanine amidase
MPPAAGRTARSGIPLVPGDDGDAVRDLQQRLRALGHSCGTDPAGHYGEPTVAAVRAFQSARGLSDDGVCGPDTWSTLVEAGYRLGDRLLYLRRPMVRGDDVAALQRRLGALGFDTGRVDGIFGPETEHALREFQRNIALTTDGVCGPDVLTALDRLGERRDHVEGVAKVRERMRLLAGPRVLAGRRVLLAEPGGLSVLARAIERLLHDEGARTIVIQHQSPSHQALQANQFDAEVAVALHADGDVPFVAYYATEGFESVGGRRLATELCEGFRAIGFPEPELRGMRLPVLRETRMPAVDVHLTPVDRVVTDAAAVAAATVDALRRWVHSPVDEVT